MKNALAAAMVAILAAPAAMANGQFEDRAWQFATPFETQTKGYIEDFIKKQKAGFYDQGAFANRIFNLGCSSDATTIGNQFSSEVANSTGSPIGVTGTEFAANVVANANEGGDSRQTSTGSPRADVGGNQASSDIGEQSIEANDNDTNIKNRQRIVDSELAANTAGNELCNVTIYD